MFSVMTSEGRQRSFITKPVTLYSINRSAAAGRAYNRKMEDSGQNNSEEPRKANKYIKNKKKIHSLILKKGNETLNKSV